MDETLVISSLEEFMMRSAADLDPFNAMSAINQDCVSIVEFCEREGPKTVLTIPANPGDHLDQAAFAVSLMTADYQNSNRLKQQRTPGASSALAPSFILADDIQVIVTNTELGIESFAHYFLLYDVVARGFVRPFCLAYSTNETGKLTRLYAPLRRRTGDALRPLKVCNRRRFLRQLAEAVDSLDSLETQTLSSYYGLYYDTNMNPSSSKPGGGGTSDSSGAEDGRPARHFRHLRLYGELRHAHRVVADSLQDTPHSDKVPVCGRHSVDISTWVARVARGGVTAQKASAEDVPMTTMDQLAACAYEPFVEACTELWRRHKRFTMIDDFFDFGAASASSASGGCGDRAELMLDDMTLLSLDFLAADSDSAKREDDYCDSTSSFDANGILKPSDQTSASDETENGGSADSDSRLLLSILPSLSQLIYPLLIGRCFLVCADKTRRPTAALLVDRLRRFVPHSATTRARDCCVDWHMARLEAIHFAETKLIGQLLEQYQALSDCLPVATNGVPHYESFISVMNLNENVFRSVRARGRILDRISRKKRAWFTSDTELTAYVHSLLAEYAAFAFVVYHVLYANRDAYRRNARHMHNFAERFRLDAGDMRVVSYFVEVMMQNCSDSVHFDGALERFYSSSAEPSSMAVKLV